MATLFPHSECSTLSTHKNDKEKVEYNRQAFHPDRSTTDTEDNKKLVRVATSLVLFSCGQLLYFIFT